MDEVIGVTIFAFIACALLFAMIVGAMFVDAYIVIWKLKASFQVLNDAGIDINAVKELIEAFKPFENL